MKDSTERWSAAETVEGIISPRYEILSTPEIRNDLLTRMNVLIKQIGDREIDVLIFLDQSARPLSWLLKDLWQYVWADKPRPAIKFVNVGLKSYAHEGSARRLTFSSIHEPWFIEDDLRRMVDRWQIDQDWLDVGQLPEDWNEPILNQSEELERLNERFQHHLKNKRVLIVDEFVDSGRSLLSSLGALSVTFPSTTFQATAVYKSKRQGREYDQKRIPWLSIPGMSGILELPDSPLLSARITPEHLEHIRTALKKSLKDEIQDLWVWMEKFHGVFAPITQFLAKHSDPIVQNRAQQLQELFEQIDQTYTTIHTNESLDEINIDRVKQTWKEIKIITSHIAPHLPSQEKKTWEDLQALLGGVNVFNYFEWDRACTIQSLLDDGYQNVKTLIERSRQLRKELKQLAVQSKGE